MLRLTSRAASHTIRTASKPGRMPLLGLASQGPSRYQKERDVAISAVLQASQVAAKVFKELVTADTVTKKDKSPVTVGDFTAQALVNHLLTHHFDYPIVGEEDSSEIEQIDRIVSLANDALSTPLATDEAPWQQLRGKQLDETAWKASIDKGKHVGGRTGRMWTLDPIDGTKGFLRGGQYAVCLALIDEGEVVLGVMGAPNLPVDFRSPSSKKGVLFFAEKGCGSFQRSFDSTETEPIVMPPRKSLADATFCESVESGHSDQSTNAAIAKELGITKEPVRMDSQAKYCSIARGDGDVYLRLPTSATYEEKIWDHAAGSLLVTEAGGTVSDTKGDPLDFGQGRTLKSNKGVVAAQSDVHPTVIAAVKKVLAS